MLQPSTAFGAIYQREYGYQESSRSQRASIDNL